MCNFIKNKNFELIEVSICNRNEKWISNKAVLNVPTLNFLNRYHKYQLVHIFAVGLLTLFRV
jgi:hypothetical protein